MNKRSVIERACIFASRLLRGRSVLGYRYISPEEELAEFVDATLGAVMGLAMLTVFVKHSEQVGGVLEGIAQPLRFLLDDVKGES